MKSRKNTFILFFLLLSTLCTLINTLTSCSSMLVNGVSTALSGASKSGVVSKKKKTDRDPMLAITGETDIQLVSDFFPTVLEMYEIMHQMNPGHAGLSSTTGSLNVMYANIFVQWPASTLGVNEFEKQNNEYLRAKYHYLKGRDYCLNALEIRHKGIKQTLLGNDTEAVNKALKKLDKNDVSTTYWCAAGWLGAFSIDLTDPDLLGTLSTPPALLERAAELDPNYSDGAIWELLATFNMAAQGFGGSEERAKECFNQAMKLTEGKVAGLYITQAESFCVPAGDKEGFIKALKTCLAIDVEAAPATRLMTTIAHIKAQRLLDNVDDYFLKW